MKTRFILLFAALTIAWALKRHYSQAAPDDLLWILTPTAQVVGAITGVSFTWQPGEGYFSREHLFLIEKSCAGVNFLIAAFAMLVIVRFHHAQSLIVVPRVLGISLAAAYGSAILVNSVRITLALWLAAHPALLSTFRPEDVHRVEGIVVYFGGLVLLFEISQGLGRRGRIVLPLAVYYAVTVAIPLINGAAHAGGATFWQHLLALLIVPPAIVALVCVVRQTVVRVESRIGPMAADRRFTLEQTPHTEAPRH